MKDNSPHSVFPVSFLSSVLISLCLSVDLITGFITNDGCEAEVCVCLSECVVFLLFLPFLYHVSTLSNSESGTPPSPNVFGPVLAPGSGSIWAVMNVFNKLCGSMGLMKV